jgi:ComF family protein
MGLGEALAWNIAVFIDELGWQANALIPIPLSEQRFAERGYNQVDTIAHPLARMLKWQYMPDALRRVRHTASQVGLSGTERRKNVLGVFCAEASKVRGKTILLLDDVTTTGATLNSASLSLLDAGAKKIYAITFAKALQRYGDDHEVSLSTRSLS